MATQPETLKFGPQWIRKLSDCAFPSQRTSNKSSVNKTSDLASNVSNDACGSKCIYSYSERTVNDSNEEFDQFDSDVWDPVLASAFDPGDKKDRLPHRSSRTKDDSSKLAHSRGLQFCPSSHNNNNNNGYSVSCSDSNRLAQAKPHSFTAVTWPKPSNFPASDRNWRRRPASTSTQHPIGFPANTNGSSVASTKWKSSAGSTNNHSSNNEDSSVSVSGNSPCDPTQLLPNSSTGRPKSSESGSPSTTAVGNETSRESLVIGCQSGSQSNIPLDCSTASNDVRQQHQNSTLDPSFVPSLSRGFDPGQTKRAVSAYYGAQSSQKRFSEAEPVASALWAQHSHLWSKSVPQQLHGFEPNASDAVSASVTAGVLAHNVGLSAPESSSVPESDRLKGYMLNPLTSLNSSSSLADPITSYHPAASSHTTTASDSYSAMNEARVFHRPDGADCPDEHLWLYEDPQGRTQGTFSDAQMQEWLSAGIYFTPTLRIRRKCDDTFSTLADYTRLFGSVPFMPNFRVPPIRGGITSSLLSLAAPGSTHLGSNEMSTSPDSLHPVSTATSVPIGITATGLSLSTPSTTLSIPGSFEPSSSGVGRSPIAHTSPRSAYAHRSDPPEFQGSIGSYLEPHLSVEDNRSVAHRKTTGGICVNSSLPVLHNRQQVAPMSLLTHSLTNGLNLGSGSNTTEGTDVNMNPSSVGHAQPVATDSTLMTLASMISLDPTLASLALPFAGQAAVSVISPGFLAALAQHLNVQPHSASHQSVSPMQQLAAIAQLAAQLAAMVGAHSPDQTPMQPAQALALAQLVMSQATPPQDQQWTSLSKRDNHNDHAQDQNCVDYLNRCGDKTVTDESTHRHPHETVVGGCKSGGTGDDSHQDTQSTWVTSTEASSGSRVSPRASDGPTQSRDTSNHTMPGSVERDRFQDGSLRISGSSTVAAVSTGSRTQAKAQSKSNAQRSLTATNAVSRIQNGFPSGSTRDADVVYSGTTNFASANNNDTSAGVNWRWAAPGSEITESKSKRNEMSAFGDRDCGQKSSPSTRQPSNQWVTKVKQTPVKSGISAASAQATTKNSTDKTVTSRTDTSSSSSSSHSTSKRANRAVTNQSKATSQISPPIQTTRSPMKTTVTTPTNQAKAAHIATTINNASTLSSLDSQHAKHNSTASTDPDNTAEHELEQLTQWCQARLSSIPMREKVDIPTVVELLATLDAPYEVERMVQTFLGESARTNQFVKDFLDRRRPFWQLHRERRDRESQVKSTSPKSSQGGGQTAQPNLTRSGDKKKRTNAQEGGGSRTNTANASAGCNGGLSWQKGGCSLQSNQTDPTQDNEWHHIKPKGGHNRKGKKDKTS